MAFESGNQKRSVGIHINEELKELKGELDEKTARITLAKFLRGNLGIAAKLLLDTDLAPLQIVLLKAMFKRNFIMQILSRGAGKSWLTGVYLHLVMIFYPNTRVAIASANFRTARRLLCEYVDDPMKKPKAELANQCYKNLMKRQDAFELKCLNGSYALGLPLTEETRGTRADVLVVDEGLLLSNQMIDEVLMPFLSSPRDAKQRKRIHKKERELIKKGLMTEDQRTIFPNVAQFIILSSACFDFQDLHKRYQAWSHLIEHPEDIKTGKDEDEDELDRIKVEKPTFLITQISHRAIPSFILDQGFVESQRSTMSVDAFNREYGAQFSKGGNGYYKPINMERCTIVDGEFPCVQLIGEPSKKYILSIDPSYSKSESADYFAMALIMIDEEKQEGIIVHQYAMVGAALQDYLKYMIYLFKCFNIVLVIVDGMGIDTFIDAINENELWKKQIGKKLTYIETFNSDREGQEYVDMIREAKNEYNENGCMVIRQNPTSSWILKANSYLQSCIDHKRIWWASRGSARPDYLSHIRMAPVPMELIKVKDFQNIKKPKGKAEDIGDKNIEDPALRKQITIEDFVAVQDFIMMDSKDQCAAIEVTTTTRGHQSFDLPSSARKSTSKNKTRKDNYSAILLGNWGLKAFFELKNQPEETPAEGFVSSFNLFS